MPPQRDVRPLVPEGAPPAPGLRHAVLIGINRYRDVRIQDLSFARSDAECLYRQLVDPELGRFPPEHVTLLLDEQATERNIVSAIGTGLRRAAGEDDLVCIYYAGHGAVDPDPGAEDGLQKYLVPHDGDVDDLFSTAIPMSRVEEFFRRIAARQVLFFLDSCYSGGANGRTFRNPHVQTRSVLSNGFLERLGARGRFVVTSCSPNEVSLESKHLDGGHGVFTHYLLKGLAGAADRDGDGLVTMGELFDYLTDNVPHHARRLGGAMTPIKTGSTEGRIYLTRYETEIEKASKELESRAHAFQERGHLDEAEEAWRELLALMPGHDVADRALKDIATMREREREKREADERARAAELLRRQGVLYGHFRSKELPPDVFEEALALLEREPAELTGSEREIRHLVDLLVAGRIQPAAFRTSRELAREASREARKPAVDSAPARPTPLVAVREPPTTVTPPAAQAAAARPPATGAHRVSDGHGAAPAKRRDEAPAAGAEAPRPEPWQRRGLRILGFAAVAGLSMFLYSLLFSLFG